jgi:hypothetical protein
LKIAMLESEREFKEKIEEHQSALSERDVTREIHPVSDEMPDAGLLERDRHSVGAYVQDCLPEGAPNVNPSPDTGTAVQINFKEHHSSMISPDLMYATNVCMGLPKREITEFSGDPKEYFNVMREFESSVARHTGDPASGLSYLLYYCEGEAKMAIKRCAILRGSRGGFINLGGLAERRSSPGPTLGN